MSDEVSAFVVYTKKAKPKKAIKRVKSVKSKQTPKMSLKQTRKPPKKTTKQWPKKLHNDAGKKEKQNGVANDKRQLPKGAKMCSTSDDSSSLSCSGSGSSFDDQDDDMDTTANMARQMEALVNECVNEACEASGFSSSYVSDGSDDDDDDASDDDDDDDGSGASEASDASAGSDAFDCSGATAGSDASDDSENEESDQFSVEYSPNDSSNSASSIKSSPVAVMSPPPAQQRRQAQKRAELFSDDNDLNNNNNKNSKPPTAKQQKLQQNALSCPLVRPTATATAAVALVTGIMGVVKSCPLPSKAQKTTTTTAPKSCPLPKADKMAADKMAAKAKSCPLPIKQQQQQEAAKQEKAKGRRSLQVEGGGEGRRSLQVELNGGGAGGGRRSLQVEANGGGGRKSLLPNGGEAGGRGGGAVNKMEPMKSKVVRGLEESARKDVHLQNSIEEGKRVLHWLLNPITPETFFAQYWEKNACQVMRKRSQYFSKLISFKMIDEMLIHNHLEFTTNIDVTSYENGVRQTHNPDGRAMPPTVWGFYGDGCSIRILNPSTYLGALRQVCTVMQEYFHCLVGANVYLTPPDSQGFAPHYDDIEAFVLQVEGRKRWRLYTPPQPSDLLARVSSGNYKQEQLGEPIFDEVLEPGDILYFPRGTVHQAVTEERQHSLHITLSVYQQQSYANLLEELMPAVLQRAIKQHLNLRRGLPLDTWQHLGLANGGDRKSEQRSQLVQNIQQMVQQYLLPGESQIDAAIDQLAKRFQHEALPPVVLPEEMLRTVFGSRSETDARGHCLADYELGEKTQVRLLRANILRLVAEGTSLRVYYYVDNALEYRKYEANFMEIQPNEAPAVEAFIKAYPNYLKISELPLRSKERRIEVATALWEHGLLMTKKPFK